MKISQKAWQKYIDWLRRIDNKAAEMMLAYVNKYGLDNRKDLIAFAYSVAEKYGAASATCAAEMFEAIADLEGRYVNAECAETATYSEVAKAVNGTAKTGNPKLLAYAIGALVRKAGADTMVKNAIKYKAQYAWISSGDSCPYCLALAAEGWRPASKDAMQGGHAEHIHANCNCTYAVRFSDSLGIQNYAPEKYQKIYADAEGDTPEEKINFLRRQHREEHKEEINEQKREAYADRKAREDAGKPETPDKN